MKATKNLYLFLFLIFLGCLGNIEACGDHSEKCIAHNQNKVLFRIKPDQVIVNEEGLFILNKSNDTVFSVDGFIQDGDELYSYRISPPCGHGYGCHHCIGCIDYLCWNYCPGCPDPDPPKKRYPWEWNIN